MPGAKVLWSSCAIIIDVDVSTVAVGTGSRKSSSHSTSGAPKSRTARLSSGILLVSLARIDRDITYDACQDFERTFRREPRSVDAEPSRTQVGVDLPIRLSSHPSARLDPWWEGLSHGGGDVNVLVINYDAERQTG